MLLAGGMLVIGYWIALEIERSAVRRAAAVAAVYVESILVTELQALQAGDARAQQALNRIFNEGPLARKVVRFKLWDSAGRVIYSNDASQVGQQVQVAGPLAAAFAGEMQAHMSSLTEH